MSGGEAGMEIEMAEFVGGYGRDLGSVLWITMQTTYLYQRAVLYT